MKEYTKDLMRAFCRAAAKPEGLSSNDFVEAILDECPDFQGKPVYVPEQGLFGHTVFIGDKVFKGPCVMGAGDEKAHDEECGILQSLEGKGLPVPRVTCVGKRAFFTV